MPTAMMNASDIIKHAESMRAEGVTYGNAKTIVNDALVLLRELARHVQKLEQRLEQQKPSETSK
jgi:7,8-dihydro-6-hydroxymethylpterin-pyrophosphokinase